MNTDLFKIEFLDVCQDDSFVICKFAFAVDVEYFNEWLLNLLDDNTIDKALHEFEFNALIMHRLSLIQNPIMKIVEPIRFGNSTLELHSCNKIIETNKEVFKGTFGISFSKENKIDVEEITKATSLTRLMEHINKEHQRIAKKKLIELLNAASDYDDQCELYKIMRIDLNEVTPTINISGPTYFSGIFEEFLPYEKYYRYPIEISDQAALKKLKEGIIDIYITEMKEILALEV